MLYVFPKDYRAKLAGKSFRMKVEPLIDKTKVLDCWRDETKSLLIKIARVILLAQL